MWVGLSLAWEKQLIIMGKVDKRFVVGKEYYDWKS
jgi:hypothetical protein